MPTPRSLRDLARCATLALALSLPACDEQFETLASGGGEPAVPTGAPWERMPAESIYGATPVENLVTTPVELDLLGIPEGWEGMRIAAVSDFQLGLWEGNEAMALAATRRAAQSDADLIVLLGDYIARGADTASLARVLAPLRGKPVLAVLGDRDIRGDSLEAAITSTLSLQGIRVLKNGSVPFVHNEDTAFIAGVDPDLIDEPAADAAWVLSRVGGGARMGLLLTHNPIMAARAPDNRFPGALAGGVFCGRVEVPGTPRLSWLNEQGLPGAVAPNVGRLYRLERTVMFVTCGVGYTFVPVRFGAAPEVALVTLRRSGVPTNAEIVQPDSLNLDSLLRRFQVSDSASADSAD